MKNSEAKNHKKKTFIRIPTFPGGKEAFLKFVADNLVYPKEALANKIEGLVYIEYDVNNLGEISNVFIKKGIGFGCDEEAIRVISMLVYEPVRNRGIRMKTHMKSRILFNLPIDPNIIQNNEMKINYSTPLHENKNKQEPESKPAYSYTITI